MLLNVKALTFDVFGTVVDWRSAIVREGHALRPGLDWPAIADDWRKLYRPTLERVTAGELPWSTFDELQRIMLDQVLDRYHVDDIDGGQRDQLSTVWRRLDPWPEVSVGLVRLKTRFAVCALSNGSMWQLISLAKHGGLPWDAILSVELFRAYKPDPRVYLGAAELLQLPPDQVLMVAAHVYDLEAAKGCGMRTAFVARPDEWGPGAGAERPAAGAFDLTAAGFDDLAAQLEA
jgi:2-haloacid dehalogenase